MAVALVVVAGPLVRILFGPQFGASAPVLEVLALVVPLRLVNSLLGTALTATDRQALRTRAVCAGAVLNLVANLALIPIFGYWGAVGSTLGTEAALGLLLFRSTRPMLSMRHRAGSSATLATPGAVI
ncbi:MAG: hypothetical protein ACYCV7_14780, partial [Acidimicrobiales bacterium]